MIDPVEAALFEAFVDVDAVDAADTLAPLDDEETLEILAGVEPAVVGRLLNDAAPASSARFLGLLDGVRAAQSLQTLGRDAAARLLRLVPVEVSGRILGELPTAEQALLRRLLSYP